MSQKLNASRQGHLDSLRGIAALIVVLVHYFAAFYPHIVFGYQENYQQHSIWEKVFFLPPFGLIASSHFAVCLFFILSGYVLSYSHLNESNRTQKIFEAIIKRPIRLGGLVWLSVFISSLLWYFSLYFNVSAAELSSSNPWLSRYWAGDFDFKGLLVDLATAAFRNGDLYNPPLWTIKMELYGSLMIYLFLLFLGQFKYRLLVAVLLVIAFKDSLYQGFWIGLAFAEIMKNYSFKNPLKSNNMFVYLLFVVFLYFVSYPNYVNQAFLKDTVFWFLPDDKGFGGGYPMLAALIIFMLAISNISLQKFLNRPLLRFLGEISYAMYIFHFLVMGSFSSWLFVFLNSYYGYHTSFLIVFVSALLLIVFVATITTKLIDKPSIRLANFVGYRVIGMGALIPIKTIFLRTKKS